MAAVKSGKGQARGAKRRRGASRRSLGRGTMAVLVLGLGGAAIIAAGGFGLRGPAGEAISGLAVELTDAGFRKLGLTVQDVTVSGRRNAPASEILEALRVDRGVAILSFDAKRARARVLDLDWIVSATVTRLFPGTIHVAVEEREPFAVWQKSGRNYVVDLKGETITEATPEVMAKLPYLAGRGAPEAAPKLLAMLEMRPWIRDKVRVALRVGQRRWTLKLDSGVDIMLPAAGAGEALDELLRLDGETEILSREVRNVDLRIPDRLTVRARGENKKKGKGDKNT